MKMMLNWTIHPDKRGETINTFANMDLDEYKAQLPDSVELIGRWHDPITGRGWSVIDTEDPEAVAAVALKWNASVDFDLAIVHDDDVTHRLAKG